MYKLSYLVDLVKVAGIMSELASASRSAYDGAKGTVNNIIIPAGEKTESLSERLGYDLGKMINLKDDDDNGELGPYKDVVRHLKDTELAEAYLRAAATLRRKARILRRRREEEEGLRSSVARSRFF